MASEEASDLRKAVPAGERRSCTWHPHVDAVLGVATETTSRVEAAFVLRCQHRRPCGATLVDIIRWTFTHVKNTENRKDDKKFVKSRKTFLVIVGCLFSIFFDIFDPVM